MYRNIYTSGTFLLSSNEIATFMAVTTVYFSHKESTFKESSSKAEQPEIVESLIGLS